MVQSPEFEEQFIEALSPAEDWTDRPGGIEVKVARLIPACNEAVFYTDRNKAFRLIDNAMNTGISPQEVIFEIVAPALEQMVTYLRENVEPNLAQYFMITRIAAKVTEKITSRSKKMPEVIGHIPEQNIRTMLEAAYEFGSHPERE